MTAAQRQAKDNGHWPSGDKENKMQREFKTSITIKGRIRAILRDAKTGEIKLTTPWANNLIPLVGLAAVARRFGGVGTYSNEGQATYGAVGKGTTTPAQSATIMEDEIARKLIAVSRITAQTVEIETFFTTAEANDDIKKFALFGEEATGAADTGTMMEYADFAVPFTKTSSETLTVEIQITIT